MKASIIMSTFMVGQVLAIPQFGEEASTHLSKRYRDRQSAIEAAERSGCTRASILCKGPLAEDCHWGCVSSEWLCLTP